MIFFYFRVQLAGSFCNYGEIKIIKCGRPFNGIEPEFKLEARKVAKSYQIMLRITTAKLDFRFIRRVTH